MERTWINLNIFFFHAQWKKPEKKQVHSQSFYLYKILDKMMLTPWKESYDQPK